MGKIFRKPGVSSCFRKRGTTRLQSGLGMAPGMIPHRHRVGGNGSEKHGRDRHDLDRIARRDGLVSRDDHARPGLWVGAVGVDQAINDDDVALAGHSKAPGSVEVGRVRLEIGTLDGQPASDDRPQPFVAGCDPQCLGPKRGVLGLGEIVDLVNGDA
jgi:hypothetical protein